MDDGAFERLAQLRVAPQEVYQYVEMAVTRHSRTVGRNHHPTMKGEVEGVLPLVKGRR